MAALWCARRGIPLRSLVATVEVGTNGVIGKRSLPPHLLTALAECFATSVTFTFFRDKAERYGEPLDAALVRCSAPADLLISGLLANTRHRDAIDAAAARCGLRSEHPFWGRDGAEHLAAIRQQRMLIRFWSTRLPLTSAEFLRPWDDSTYEALLALEQRNHMQGVGELGGYESFVLGAPGWPYAIDAALIAHEEDGEKYLTCDAAHVVRR